MKGVVRLDHNRHKPLYSLFLIAVLFACMEMLYSNISGVRNMQVLCILLALNVFAYIMYDGTRIFRYVKKKDLLGAIMLIVCLVHGSGIETIRYALMFLLIWVMNKQKIRNLEAVHIFLILTGFFLAVYQVFFRGEYRANGYTASSATIFGLEMTISLYYILFSKSEIKYKYIILAMAAISIVLSRSRSAEVILVILLSVYYLDSFLYRHKREIGQAYIAVGIILCIGLVFLSSFLDFEAFFYGRDNALASTNTRVWLIQRVISNMEGLADWIFGKGGGYTVNILKRGISRVPLHQDIVMFICEYGCLGTILLYISFIHPLKLDILMLMVLLAGTFQNIFTSTTGIVLFTLTSVAMQYDRKESVILKRIESDA